jgi:hypothetical protein
MRYVILIFLFLISSNSFSQEKSSTNFSLTIGSALVDNSFLFNPEIEASHTLLKDRLLTNLSFGIWINTDSNYEYSENGVVSNYQKIGFSYKIINNSKYIRKIKIVNKNKKIKIIKTKKNVVSGLFIGGDIIHNTFINGERRVGYGLKSFYLFKNSLILGYEYINTSSDNNLSFKLHSLNIGVQF